MRPASRTRAATKPRAAVSLCRLATGNSTTAVPTHDSARATSRKAPHITPVSLPAPRTKSAWSRRGAYSFSVGIDVTNVSRYSTPATRAVPRLGRADGRTVGGSSAVVGMLGSLEPVVWTRYTLAVTPGVLCPPVKEAAPATPARPLLAGGGGRWLRAR